ncbi:MAG TPA: hypothetical protein VM030_11530 [Acidimicrobiales bacterium]|nr:hypothetical protein [Acidimicrobiales bacterium]
MRRRLGLLLVVVLLGPLPGAAAPGLGSAVDETPLAAAQRLLDTRVTAVKRGDRAAFLATVDPEAPRSFRDAQGSSFDGLRSVPLSGYRLEARVSDTGDLAAGAKGRYGGAPVFLPETRQTYRLEGYDDRDVIDALWLTYVRRGDRWYVGGDTDLQDLGIETTRNLWDLGPVRLKPTDHFLVLSHPGQAERADALAGLVERAVKILDQRWPLPWSGRIPLILPGSVKELETIIQSTVDLDKFVAFVGYGANRDAGFRLTAPRMYIQDKNLGKYPADYQVETLVHELTHAAAVAVSGQIGPNWMHEGTAEWSARGRPTNDARPRGADRALPRDYEFNSGSQSEIVRAYGEARSAVSTLARLEGVDAPPAFLQAMGRIGVEPGTTDYHVDRVLRAVTGMGTAELERAWVGR